MLKIFIEDIKNVPQVVLVFEIKNVELAKYPAGPSSDEAIVAGQFRENELLEKSFSVLSVFSCLHHMYTQKAESVQKCFFYSEIFVCLLQVVDKKLHV